MNNRMDYMKKHLRMGWGFMIVGMVLIIAGLVLQFFSTLPFNVRIISGLGICIVGVGIAEILRYLSYRKEPQSAARLINEDLDERSRMIRMKAGNRAFWVSLALTYAALMWLSFAGNGSLPTPDPDTLWFYMAAAVMIPFIIYIVSIVYDRIKN